MPKESFFWFDEALPYDNASFDMGRESNRGHVRPTSRTAAVEYLRLCRPEERVKGCEDNECKVEREDPQKSVESPSQRE